MCGNAARPSIFAGEAKVRTRERQSQRLLEQRRYAEENRGGHDADAKREADDCRNQLKESCACIHNLYPE